MGDKFNRERYTMNGSQYIRQAAAARAEQSAIYAMLKADGWAEVGGIWVSPDGKSSISA